MFVIAHRGAAGLAPENTMQALSAGTAAGADMLEFDVRLTKDGVPVVIHDARLLRTHHQRDTIAHLTLKQLQLDTVTQPVPTLVEVLDTFYGKILLNIELKSRGSGKVVFNLLKKHYIKKPRDWDSVLLSSFRGKELTAVRRLSSRANLALLHDENPYIFIAYQRKLNLTAVGFHKHYVNPFALEIAKRSGLFTYAYTVDNPKTAALFQRQGIDGIVTNYPDKLIAELEKIRVSELPSL